MDVEIRIVGNDRDEANAELASLAAALGVTTGAIAFEPTAGGTGVVGTAIGAVARMAA
ncbi:hypothetical protein LG047_00490 [Methylocystis sp. WRRC1]|uniref:hypothetical protein n=1 Tax=Methylocystis sp. WRRC1 TaxID=1732014 RepID=UPI001D15B69B|nr:hypothetical protein [Methylocystis sp. WRRC1]MCC3243814.1 hypothetical protein [Methylocystis sp. WRRC1]